MEISVNLGLPITVVPCWHQSNVYIKRNESKSMESLKMYSNSRLLQFQSTGQNTNLTVILVVLTFKKSLTHLHSNQPKLSSVSESSTRPVMESPKMHSSSWCKTALTCAGLQTTPSHVSQYRAKNGNLWKTPSTICHGALLAPNQCLHHKEATGIRYPSSRMALSAFPVHSQTFKPTQASFAHTNISHSTS